MRSSLRKGIGFGLSSGVITTLGMIVGLHSGTHSTAIVIAGILLIAISDAFSDALGIHISEESALKNNHKEIWEATISTFFSKLCFALSFVVPFLLFSLTTAIVASIAWGFFVIIIFSYYLARKQKIRSYKVIFEHLLIAMAVIVITHYVGKLISGLML